MHEDLALLCDPDRRAVQRAAVAEQDDVADRRIADQIVEKTRPFRRAAAKINPVGNSPKRIIAAVEINAMHPVAARGESRTETLEKSRRQALKKKKAATGRRRLVGKRHPLHPTGHLTIQSHPPGPIAASS